MIEMVVDSMRSSLVDYRRVVILKEKDTSRYIPIWIDAAEGHAIAVKLQDISVQRPLTHDLMVAIIDALGGKVDSIIVVNDLQKNVYFSKITLNREGELIEIDSRPSDAINLAMRVQMPMFAVEAVLNRVSAYLDKDTSKSVENGIPISPNKSITPKIEVNPPKSAGVGINKQLEAYCVKCRSKKEMKDAKTITMKNNETAYQGVCPTCGTQMFKVINKDDVGLDEQLIKVMLYRIAIAGPSTPLDILDGHEFPDKSRLVFLREEPNCSISRSIFISMGTAEADPIADSDVW